MPSVLTSGQETVQSRRRAASDQPADFDIALQYRFDSQQTFTAPSKTVCANAGAVPPRRGLNAFGICPPIRLGAFTLPQPEFVSLPDKHLVGLTQSYSCTLEQITTVRTELRSQFWRQFLGDARNPAAGAVRAALLAPKPGEGRRTGSAVYHGAGAGSGA